MRTIDIALNAGMHPTGMDSRASKWMRGTTGLRLTDHGAEAWPEMGLVSFPQTYGWKTSAAFLRRDGVLLRCQKYGASGAALYEGAVDTAITVSGVSAWAVSPVGTPGAATLQAPVSWSFVDLGGAWFLFDGAGGVYFRTGHNSYTWFATYGQRCGCAHNGRLILGGFDAAHAWDHAAWPTFFETYHDDMPDACAGIKTMGSPGQNWVWWSSPGADDALFFYNKTHLEGTIVDLMTMNASGFAVMPWPGVVRRTLALSGGFMVYGDNGATFMGEVESPTPGYGVRRVEGWPDGMGVLGADGTEAGHTVVATDGTVWMVSPDSGGGAKAEEIGYKWLFAGSTTLTVVRDSKHGGCFIGPNANGVHYYLDRHGLAGMFLKPGNVYVPSDGTWTGALAAAAAHDWAILTDTYPVTGGATVAAVKLHGTWNSSLHMSLYFQRNGVWVESDVVYGDTRGIFSFGIPVNQFRVMLHSTTDTGVKLERLEVFLDGLTVDGNPELRSMRSRT